VLQTLRRTPHAIGVARLRIGTIGDPSPERRSRLTFDRSPVRESRTPGSVRGAASNRRPYRDRRKGSSQ